MNVLVASEAGIRKKHTVYLCMYQNPTELAEGWPTSLVNLSCIQECKAPSFNSGEQKVGKDMSGKGWGRKKKKHLSEDSDKRGGERAPCYSETICKHGCWSQAKDEGTAGAPPWLINVARRTSFRCEWRQKQDYVQWVCNVIVIKW